MNAAQLSQLLAPKGRYAQLLGNRLARGGQPREVPQQITFSQRRGRRPAGNRTEREIEQRCRQVGVEPLVRTNVPLEAGETEECRPSDEPARSADAAAEVGRICRILLGRIEEHGEEGTPRVAGEVCAI